MVVFYNNWMNTFLHERMRNKYTMCRIFLFSIRKENERPKTKNVQVLYDQNI